jgi:hypothetical protein
MLEVLIIQPVEVQDRLILLLTVPKQFAHVWSFWGSSFQLPSMTNLYSYMLGASITVFFHTPLLSFSIGCVLGSQLLKSPVKKTSLASGALTEKVTF